jgi:hypothetical protein
MLPSSARQNVVDRGVTDRKLFGQAFIGLPGFVCSAYSYDIALGEFSPRAFLPSANGRLYRVLAALRYHVVGVVLLVAKPQVLRPYTSFVVTVVKYAGIFRYWSITQFPCCAMGESSGAAAVTIRPRSACPVPAIVGFDHFTPEPFGKMRVSVATPAGRRTELLAPIKWFSTHFAVKHDVIISHMARQCQQVG